MVESIDQDLSCSGVVSEKIADFIKCLEDWIAVREALVEKGEAIAKSLSDEVCKRLPDYFWGLIGDKYKPE